MTPELTDLQVVQQVLDGNRDAFSVVLKRYKRPIFNFIYRFCNNYDLAQELTQETFLRCFKFLRSYDQHRTFSTWLYTVARNLCIDELKKRSPTREVPLEDVLPVKDGPLAGPKTKNPDHIALQKDNNNRLREALYALNEYQRMVVMMHVWDDLSFEEIGTKLRKAESAVKMAYGRAKKQLRTILGVNS